MAQFGADPDAIIVGRSTAFGGGRVCLDWPIFHLEFPWRALHKKEQISQ
jgi:hypothetical protein